MWLAEHLEDVESDLSAFHRVDDIMRLDAVRFFTLAIRLGAYAGVVQARLLAEREESGDHPVSSHQAATTSAPPTSTTNRPTVVSNDVALAQLADGWVERERTEG